MRARSKFRDGHWPDVQAELRGERARLGPSASVYCLSIKYDAPGVFYLAAILPTAAGTPRREYFTVSPSGFYFRKRARPRSRSNPTLPYPTYPTLPYPTASALCGGRKQQAAAAASSNSSKQLLPKVLARLSRRSPQTCSGVRPGGAPSSQARWLWRSKAYYRRGSEHASQSGNLWMAIWLCRASLVQREEGRQNAPGAINMLPVLAKCHGC